MSREVDVKALISHIVRGDGADKCRICMGDTSEGQVFLGDTVMMDGERPVTLAELLEVITGVEVPFDDELPNGLCSLCSRTAVDAANFFILCRQVQNRWNRTVQLLETLPRHKDTKKITAIYAILSNDNLNIIEENEGYTTLDIAPLSKLRSAKRINKEPSYITVKPKRKKKTLAVRVCQCPTCGKDFQYAHHLSSHLKESFDLLRACHICAETMTRDKLIDHLKDVHKINPYPCKKCPSLFHLQIKYIKHLKKAHASGVCTCGDCGRTFQSPLGYHAHKGIHIARTCPSCNMMFRNRKCYFHHIKLCCNISHRNTLKHRKTKAVKRCDNTECICDYCGKKFSSRKFIMAHIQHVHLKNTHRPCPYCGRSVASAHMTEHIKKHELVREYKCEHCNIVLKSRIGFIQHIHLHTGEKPYACKQCGETFSASSKRSVHIKKVHNTQLLYKHHCDDCPARFTLPSELKRHKLTVHSIGREGIVFECNECHEKFGSCVGLVHHRRKHQKNVDMAQIIKKTC